MDKIDLIIDALERANELWLTEPIGEQALAAARELRALKPVVCEQFEPESFYLGQVKAAAQAIRTRMNKNE